MMKSVLSFGMCILMVALLFTGCGTSIFSVDSAQIASIAILTPNGTTVTLNDSDEVNTVVQLINKAQLTSATENEEKLPEEQYRLSLLDKNNIAKHTITVFSKELLQVDDRLYTGTAGSLVSTLETHCAAKTLVDLSPVFSMSADEIVEISFQDIFNEQFKLVTKPDEFESILKPLQNLKLSNSFTPTTVNERYSINVCKADTNEYLPAIEISVYEEGTMLTCDGKSTYVCNFNWSNLYEKLDYNNMKLPS